MRCGMATWLPVRAKHWSIQIHVGSGCHASGLFTFPLQYIILHDFLQVSLRERVCVCVCARVYIYIYIYIYTVRSQKNGAVSKVNKKFISHLTRAKRTPSAALTVPVSHALPAVHFSCLLRGRGVSFQNGPAAGKGLPCAPFWGVQIFDYSAAWVSCTV